MKRFYRCPICGSEFCLKGRKYCEEGGGMYCSGNPTVPGKPFKKHKQILMDYAGETIMDLRELRRKHRNERKLI